MNRERPDRSIRFARRWVNAYTSGLVPAESASRRAEIESDLAEHVAHRENEGWSPRRIARERLHRLVRGMASDLAWRHDLLSRQSQAHGLVRGSIVLATSLATALLACFHFAFTAYLLGRTSLVDEPFLSGLESYADEIDRPIASVVAATVIAVLGLVLAASAVARPFSPVMANAATIAVAVLAVMFFWLGMWPIGLIAIIGSTADIATRAATPDLPHSLDG